MRRCVLGAAGLCVAMAMPGWAAEMADAGMVKVEPALSAGALSLTVGADAKLTGEATVSVEGPGDFFASAVTKSDAPRLELKGARLQDGLYTYQLAAPSAEMATISESRKALDNGRGDGGQRVEPRVPVVLSGTFTVENGKIVVPKPAPEKVEGGSAGDDQDQQ